MDSRGAPAHRAALWGAKRNNLPLYFFVSLLLGSSVFSPRTTHVHAVFKHGSFETHCSMYGMSRDEAFAIMCGAARRHRHRKKKAKKVGGDVGGSVIVIDDDVIVIDDD